MRIDPTTSRHRILTVSPEDQALIERAAGLAGQPVEVFVNEALRRAARNVIDVNASTRLTTQGRELLLRLLDTPSSMAA